MLRLPKRRRTWFFLLLAICLMASSWPGYKYWVRYKTERFQSECETAQKKGDWKALEAASREWLAFDEHNGDAWLYLAVAAQEQKDISLTVFCLDRVPDDHPKIVAVLHERIDLLLELNRPRDCEKTCLRLLDLEPLATRAHRRLTYLLAFTLQRVELSRRIRESISLDRESPEAYIYLFTLSSLRFSNGQKTVGKWLEHDPDYEPFVVAYAYFRAVNPEDETGTIFEGNDTLTGEQSLIQECLKRYPKNPEVLAYHLRYAVTEGKVDRVGELLNECANVEGLGSRYFAVEGWYYSARQQLPKAEEAYRRALKADPYNWRARHELATVLRLQNKVKEGAKEADIAVVGKELERKMFGIPRAEALTRELFAEMADYAEKCGDFAVSTAIRRRLGIAL